MVYLCKFNTQVLDLGHVDLLVEDHEWTTVVHRRAKRLLHCMVPLGKEKQILILLNNVTHYHKV